MEKGLANPEDNQRIKPTANNSQHEGNEDGAAEFGEKSFHRGEIKIKIRTERELDPSSCFSAARLWTRLANPSLPRRAAEKQEERVDWVRLLL